MNRFTTAQHMAVREFADWLADRDINLVTFSSDGGAFIEDTWKRVDEFLTWREEQ